MLRPMIVVLGSFVCLAGVGCSDPPAWTEQNLPTDASFRDFSFLDEERGWLVGGGYPVEGGILGTTVDGGTTWRFRSGLVTKPGSRLYYLEGVHFTDARHGVIAASDGWILRSVDGGEHWHRLLHAGRTLSTLFFLEAAKTRQVGWAAGDGWVLRTLDGGATWERMNPHSGPHQDFRALDVHFADEYRGWLVGHHGVVRWTVDAGRRWERASVPAEASARRLSAVTFVDEDHGWIVGEAGSILHSADRGRTWTMQSSPVDAFLTDVAFSDLERGWAVGYSDGRGHSTLLTTTDRGATWVTAASIEGEALETLLLRGDGSVWSVGERARRLPQRILRYAPAAPAAPTP